MTSRVIFICPFSSLKISGAIDFRQIMIAIASELLSVCASKILWRKHEKITHTRTRRLEHSLAAHSQHKHFPRCVWAVWFGSLLNCASSFAFSYILTLWFPEACVMCHNGNVYCTSSFSYGLAFMERDRYNGFFVQYLTQLNTYVLLSSICLSSPHYRHSVMKFQMKITHT